MLDTWISRSYLNVSISFMTVFARAVLARTYKEEISSQNRFGVCRTKSLRLAQARTTFWTNRLLQ